MKKKVLQISFLFGLAVMVACGQAPKNEESQSEEKTEMKEEHADHDHDKMMEEKKDEGQTDLLAVPDSAKVFFAGLEQSGNEVDPETGESMGVVKVMFGVEGMEVEPAGELNEGKGHHHLIINGGPLEAGIVVPADSVNIHYGKGQTETELRLPAGEHTLTMQFADGYHRSYGEQLSVTETIVVK
jgi:hypothetical protein